jgi:NADH-quinone oxidoreductase subunit E
MNEARVQTAAVDLSAVDAILDRHARSKAALIHILQDVQTELHYLPREAVERVARGIGVPFAKAFAVATFYKSFSLEPRGDIVLRICTGTACHIRGAQVLVDEAVETLGVEPGRTTADLKFTVETVNCVGACAMAPVVQAGERYLGNLKPGELTKFIRIAAVAPSGGQGHAGGEAPERVPARAKKLEEAGS